MEPIDADILAGLAELAGPLRGFAEELLVQLAQETFFEDFFAQLACPMLAPDEVDPLPHSAPVDDAIAFSMPIRDSTHQMAFVFPFYCC